MNSIILTGAILGALGLKYYATTAKISASPNPVYLDESITFKYSGFAANVGMALIYTRSDGYKLTDTLRTNNRGEAVDVVSASFFTAGSWTLKATDSKRLASVSFTVLESTEPPTPPPSPTTGVLSVASIPTGASIWINGVSGGTTPNDITMNPGNYTISVTLYGYDKYTKNVTITAGYTTELDVTLNPTVTPSTGALDITSVPIGASISINGVSYGNAPKSITLSAGSYNVVVSASGYNSYTTNVTITVGYTTHLDVTLVVSPPTTGILSIMSNPSGASIFINGTSAGTTPRDVVLNPGNYAVTVSAQGYNSYSTSVLVTAGYTTHLDVNLVAIPTDRPSIIAANGTASAIQSAINSIFSQYGYGDVYVPTGTYNLGGVFTTKAGIRVFGAGIDNTILLTSGTSQMPVIGGNNSRLSGFSLISPSYNGGNGIKVGSYYDFRIDHLHIEGYGTDQAAIYTRGANTRGVIDHCYIKNKAVTSLNYGVSVYSGDVWNENMQLGTGYAVFIEDCTFINCRHCVASNLASHYVFRYNLCQHGVAGQAVDAHGPAYGSNTGSRAFEVYDNIIELPESSAIDKAICIRGGGGVIFNNIIRGYRYGTMFRIEDNQTLGAYPLYHQPHDVYVWNNQCDGPYPVGYANLYNTSFYVQQNRDWFAYALPGYTPYAYPHPLVD